MRTGSISFHPIGDALTYVNSDLNNKVVFITCRGELFFVIIILIVQN